MSCQPSSVLCPLSSVFCLLPSAFCPLSSEFCRLSSVFCLQSLVFCLLPSAFCPLSSVLCILSSVFCLLSSVSCLLSSAFCFRLRVGFGFDVFRRFSMFFWCAISSRGNRLLGRLKSIIPSRRKRPSRSRPRQNGTFGGRRPSTTRRLSKSAFRRGGNAQVAPEGDFPSTTE